MRKISEEKRAEMVRLRVEKSMGLKDIAKIVGVSKSTASIVLRDTPIDPHEVRNRSHESRMRRWAKCLPEPVRMPSIEAGAIPHHTKVKGDIGLLAAHADMAQQGYLILHPLTEHAPFDVVLYDGSKFLRTQVRYSYLRNNGTLVLHFYGTWSDTRGRHKKMLSDDQIDLFCIYCPERRQCYYVSPPPKGKKSLALRIEPARNGQTENTTTPHTTIKEALTSQCS